MPPGCSAPVSPHLVEDCLETLNGLSIPQTSAKKVCTHRSQVHKLQRRKQGMLRTVLSSVMVKQQFLTTLGQRFDTCNT